VEFSGVVLPYHEAYTDPVLQQVANAYQQQQYGTQLFRNGTSMPLGVAFIQETTIFREYGPLAGSTMRLAYDASPKVSKFLSNQTADADTRYYLRLGENGLLAVRARGFKSWGTAPNYTFFGGNSEMRGYDYREFLGHKAFYANAELRFPLITAMATPLGVLGGIRGVFFFDLGGAVLAQQKFTLYDRNTQVVNAVTAASPTQLVNTSINGFRLVNSRASYGIGLETFALGFPVHFDWSWRTLFNKPWEDIVYASSGGSAALRKVRLTAWIGYDF
jgi:outer membrane protein assembly factor BamA